jgi:hypothetical protein
MKSGIYAAESRYAKALSKAMPNAVAMTKYHPSPRYAKQK